MIGSSRNTNAGLKACRRKRPPPLPWKLLVERSAKIPPTKHRRRPPTPIRRTKLRQPDRRRPVARGFFLGIRNVFPFSCVSQTTERRASGLQHPAPDDARRLINSA